MFGLAWKQPRGTLRVGAVDLLRARARCFAPCFTRHGTRSGI